jgi:uncharacterized protein YqgV (UPF0045/DUF77 family)
MNYSTNPSFTTIEGGFSAFIEKITEPERCAMTCAHYEADCSTSLSSLFVSEDSSKDLIVSQDSIEGY